MAMRTELQVARAITHLSDIIRGAAEAGDLQTTAFATAIRDALQWVACESNDSPLGFGEVVAGCDTVDLEQALVTTKVN